MQIYFSTNYFNHLTTVFINEMPLVAKPMAITTQKALTQRWDSVSL
jgi:hypothetical protein